MYTYSQDECDTHVLLNIHRILTETKIRRMKKYTQYFIINKIFRCYSMRFLRK